MPQTEVVLGGGSRLDKNAPTHESKLVLIPKEVSKLEPVAEKEFHQFLEKEKWGFIDFDPSKLSYKAFSPNNKFVLYAEQGSVAANLAVQSEDIARSINEKWFNKSAISWQMPLPIGVNVGQTYPTSGSTNFNIGRSPINVLGTVVQGNLNSIMCDALPHEISHSLLIAHLGHTPPRWVEEAVATSAESSKVLSIFHARFKSMFEEGDRIFSLKTFLPAVVYPGQGLDNTRQQAAVLDFYAQSVTFMSFLVDKGADGTLHSGERKAMECVKLVTQLEAAEGFKRKSELGENFEHKEPIPNAEIWQEALRRTYGFKDLDEASSAFIRWSISR